MSSQLRFTLSGHIRSSAREVFRTLLRAIENKPLPWLAQIYQVPRPDRLINGKVPRPPNSFVLFKSWISKSFGSEEASITGELWGELKLSNSWVLGQRVYVGFSAQPGIRRSANIIPISSSFPVATEKAVPALRDIIDAYDTRRRTSDMHPRPSNNFTLSRTWVIKAFGKEPLAQLAMWDALRADESPIVQHFSILSRDAKLEHEEAFHGYIYRPNKGEGDVAGRKASTRKKLKTRGESENVEAQAAAAATPTIAAGGSTWGSFTPTVAYPLAWAPIQNPNSFSHGPVPSEITLICSNSTTKTRMGNMVWLAQDPLRLLRNQAPFGRR